MSDRRCPHCKEAAQHIGVFFAQPSGTAYVCPTCGTRARWKVVQPPEVLWALVPEEEQSDEPAVLRR